MARFRAPLLAALGFLLIPFALFWPVTLGGRTLIPADDLFFFEPWTSVQGQFNVQAPETPHNDLPLDLLLENYAWKKFITQSLQEQQLPLWNPYLFGGIPFLAAGQHSALYPFSVLFYILPIPLAFGWFVVSQFFLAGIFAYLFLRSLDQSPLAAFAGGLIYEFSLFMVVSVTFPMILAGAVWLPLVLAAVVWIIQQRPALGGRPASLPWLAVGAVALGCQALAGHPEVIYYTLLIAGALSGWLLILNTLALRRASQAGLKQLTVGLLRPSIYLLAMVGLGLAMGSVQLIPLAAVLPENFRAGAASLEQVRGWGYPARHILHFLIPNIFGNPAHHGYWDLFTGQWTPATINALGQPITKIDWGPPITNYVEGGAYVGILPLLLATFGVISARVDLWAKPSPGSSRVSATSPLTYKIFFSVLACLCLAFAFGTPLYALIYYLPGLNQLHSPFRWVWPFSLCIAVLAGFGLDYLRQQLAGRLLTLISLATTAAGAALLGLLVLIRLDFAPFEPLLTRLLNDLALANTAFADARMFFSYEAVWVGRLGLLLLGSGICLWLARRQNRWWLPVAVSLIAIDLLSASAGFNSAVSTDVLSYTPPVVNFLKQDTGYWRFTAFDPNGTKPFNANVGWFYDLQDVRGYDSIIPKRYANYMNLIEPQGELQFNRIAPISNLQSLDSPLLDLLNVKYVLTNADIPLPKYKLVYTDPGIKVYENLGVAARAFSLPLGCALSTTDFARAVQTYDPRQFAILDGNGTAGLTDKPASESAACTPAAADITGYTINEVTLNVGPIEPSFLVLADSYATDWRAFVRPVGSDPDTEQEVPLYLADGNFRAVKLDATEQGWTIRLKYSPNSVKFGGFTSVIAVLAIVIVGGMWLWRYFYRESAVDSAARRIAKNSVAPMALNLTNRAIDLVFATFMLRLLGPADAGSYYFAIVIIGWFDIWTNFGLNTYLTREVARDRTHANHYLINTTILRIVLGAVSFPVLGLFVLAFMRWGNLGSDTALAIILLAIGLAPSSVSTGLTALFYSYEKAEYPAAITTFTTLLKVAFGAIALLLGYSFVGLSAVTILVNGITMLVLIVLVIRLFFWPRWDFDWRMQVGMLRESWPLMLNHLLATLFFKVDVTLLEPLRGSTEVGWYSTGYKFIDAFNVIPSFFTFALFPIMSRQAHDDRPGLIRSFTLAIKLLVAVAIPLAVFTTFLAPTMIGILGGQEYLPYGAIALMIMVWSMPVGWINSVTNYVLIALGQQRALTRAFIIGLTFNVVANLIFIPIYGYPAAAVITVLSEIAEGIPFYLTLNQTLAPIPWFHILWRLGVSGLAMLAATWLGWQLHPILGLVAGGLVYGLLVLRLGAFDEAERTQLISTLPSRVRHLLNAP